MFSCYASRELKCGVLRHVFLFDRQICREMFPAQMNLTPRTQWEEKRASHLAGETMDAETGMESGGILKSR